MTFRLRHEWSQGTRVLSARLSACVHCETLRVLEDDAIPFRTGRVHFIQRAVDPASPEDRRANLIVEDEPACIAPTGFFKAPEDRAEAAAPAAAPPALRPPPRPAPPPDPQGRLW